jgi:hypothetical protein
MALQGSKAAEMAIRGSRIYLRRLPFRARSRVPARERKDLRSEGRLVPDRRRSS